MDTNTKVYKKTIIFSPNWPNGPIQSSSRDVRPHLSIYIVPSPCNFQQIGPRGRFGLVVGMSVLMSLCPLPMQYFNQPGPWARPIHNIDVSVCLFEYLSLTSPKRQNFDKWWMMDDGMIECRNEGLTGPVYWVSNRVSRFYTQYLLLWPAEYPAPVPRPQLHDEQWCKSQDLSYWGSP